MVTKRRSPKPKAPVKTLADIRGENVLAKASEVSRVLRVHRSTVHRLCERGELVGTMIGDTLRIQWDSVEQLISRGYQKTASA